MYILMYLISNVFVCTINSHVSVFYNAFILIGWLTYILYTYTRLIVVHMTISVTKERHLSPTPHSITATHT